MKNYRIIEPMTENVIAEKNQRGDLTARKWLARLIQSGAISGIPVQLERRTMSDESAATLPPFANGKKQSAWSAI